MLTHPKILLLFLAFIILSMTYYIYGKSNLPSSTITNLESPQLTDTDFKVAAAGDISCPSLTPTKNTCQQQATANLIQQLNPEFVLTLGDTQYETNSYSDFINFYDKSWGKFKQKTKPAIGNHEYMEKNASGYFDYFNGVGQIKGQAGDRDKGYYSYQKNNWKFYSLNSNCAEIGGCEKNSPQVKWLEQELKNSNATCQLAYFHHPFFSSGEEHGSTISSQPLWQILYEHNVDLVLNGHDHLYERFSPQDSQGKSDPKGAREFVVGTGGKSLYKIGKILPNSEIRINDKFGVLELTLKNSDYSWRFITINGQTLDSGTSPCH